MMDPALGRLFPGFEDHRIQVPDRLDDHAADPLKCFRSPSCEPVRVRHYCCSMGIRKLGRSGIGWRHDWLNTSPSS